MYSCVKVITPSGGTVPFTETITGINDATTGTPFEVRTMILLGGNTAATNTLCYNGMASSNSAGDSSWHHDWGVMHETKGGAFGQGFCHDFNAKIGSGAAGYGYPFMDTWPDIFFGGYIGGLGYVNNVVAGAFDITWDRRDRSGDSKIILCIGGNDYGVHFISGASTGTVGPPVHIFPSKPQAVFSFPAYFPSTMPNGSATGAGAGSIGIGWDIRDGIRGTSYQEVQLSVNQREHWDDRFNADGANVTAWTDTTYTIAGGTGGGGLQMIWCGDNVVAKAGKFTCPSSDSSYSFNLGLNAKFVFFTSVGTTAAQEGTLDTVEAAGSYGWVDPSLSQACFWTGDTTIGNGVPLLGARYLDTNNVVRTGHANAASSTFANFGEVTALDSTGAITLDFTSTDGTSPEILWFAIGLEAEELGTIEVDKVWAAEEPGRVTLRIGTTEDGLDIGSQLTGANGSAPLTLGPISVPVGTYYVSESNTYLWQSAMTATRNGEPVEIGENGLITVANGDEVIVTITNADLPLPGRPLQWRLYRLDLKPRGEETS